LCVRKYSTEIAASQAKKIQGQVGWHTLRHSYRAWLDETGAPLGVQQKLMRHANISTTMNVYGGAFMEAKRKANTSVVQRVLVRDHTKQQRSPVGRPIPADHFRPQSKT
jgi:integrase